MVVAERGSHRRLGAWLCFIVAIFGIAAFTLAGIAVLDWTMRSLGL
jgi:hypothetical protein